MQRTDTVSSKHHDVAEALKGEMYRALRRMDGYDEHFSDGDVSIDVTQDGADLAVNLYAHEPQGLEGTSMATASQQWNDEMNARESAVSDLRAALMANPAIQDTEFDNSDELYGKKSDFVSALNKFFDAKGLPPITNPLLVGKAGLAAAHDEIIRGGLKDRIIAGYEALHGGLSEFRKDYDSVMDDSQRLEAMHRNARDVIEISGTGTKENSTLSFDYQPHHFRRGQDEAAFIVNLNEYLEKVKEEILKLHPHANVATTALDYVYYKDEQEMDGAVEYLEDEAGHDGLEISGHASITAPRAMLFEAISALAPVKVICEGGIRAKS